MQYRLVWIISANLLCNIKIKEDIFPVKFDKYLTSLFITLKYKHSPEYSCLTGTSWKIQHFY